MDLQERDLKKTEDVHARARARTTGNRKETTVPHEMT
jgi:hypothetical protein